MKLRFLTFLAAVMAVLVLAPVPVLAEKRIALVTGNGAYEIGRLPNPANDARLVAKTLCGLGFDVIKRTDLKQLALKKAIIDFGELLGRAGSYAVGLFFYAGADTPRGHLDNPEIPYRTLRVEHLRDGRYCPVSIRLSLAPSMAETLNP